MYLFWYTVTILIYLIDIMMLLMCFLQSLFKIKTSLALLNFPFYAINKSSFLFDLRDCSFWCKMLCNLFMCTVFFFQSEPHLKRGCNITNKAHSHRLIVHFWHWKENKPGGFFFFYIIVNCNHHIYMKKEIKQSIVAE